MLPHALPQGKGRRHLLPQHPGVSAALDNHRRPCHGGLESDLETLASTVQLTHWPSVEGPLRHRRAGPTSHSLALGTAPGSFHAPRVSPPSLWHQRLAVVVSVRRTGQAFAQGTLAPLWVCPSDLPVPGRSLEAPKGRRARALCPPPHLCAAEKYVVLGRLPAPAPARPHH